MPDWSATSPTLPRSCSLGSAELFLAIMGSFDDDIKAAVKRLYKSGRPSKVFLETLKGIEVIANAF